MFEQRLIGEYTGEESGPLFICFGGMHGNEPAGVEAIKVLFSMLEEEPKKNPGFSFRGRMVGILGNTKAFQKKIRFIEKDLNRQWTLHHIKQIMKSPYAALENEDAEIFEIITFIRKEIVTYLPEQIYVLDLHTTTADGGIFTIACNDHKSVAIGTAMHAPVIKGLLKGIKGTSMHYFNTKNLGVPTISATFESGQHNDPLSINRAISAIVNCLRTIGCVRPRDVENRHDAILESYAMGLPKIAELIMVHRIKPEDRFMMLPGYKNFQKIEKGEVLAIDKNGPIKAIEDSCILMPLYQKQGDDGFFLVKPLAW